MIFQRWTIEPSREGIPLVFGDGKYPQDPPRVASELEAALADAYAGAVEDRVKLLRWIHETSKHFVDPAEQCKSCAILVDHLELTGGQS
jgi:hypothetical protein